MPTWQRVEHPDTPSGRGADWPTQASIRRKPRSWWWKVQTRCRRFIISEAGEEDNHQARGDDRPDAECGHELLLHLLAHPTDQQIAAQQAKTTADGQQPLNTDAHVLWCPTVGVYLPGNDQATNAQPVQGQR